VVSRHDDLGLGQTIEKGSRCQKFLSVGSLRQVARDDHYVRHDSAHGFYERIEDLGIDATEVYIREMGDLSAHGAITLSAPGRVR